MSTAPGYSRGLPPKRDLVVKDGDTIKLGDESIKVYLTPGHSPAPLAMLIPVKDHGLPKLLAYFGGVENPLMLPETTGGNYDAFEKSFARMGQILKAARVDGYIAAHTNYDEAPFKIEVMRHNPPTLPNPFLIGTDRVVLFTKMSRECNLNNASLHLSFQGSRVHVGKAGLFRCVAATLFQFSPYSRAVPFQLKVCRCCDRPASPEIVASGSRSF